MRARQRHLNPKAAGAALVLDARYITGLNNNDAVTTWSDRSGNAYDPTQSSSTLKPLYKTGQINGNPVVTFDGSNDHMSFNTPLDFTAFIGVIKTSTTALFRTVLCVRKASTATAAAIYYQTRSPARLWGSFRLPSSESESDFVATASVLGSGQASVVSSSRSNTAMNAGVDGVFGTEDTTTDTLTAVSTITYVGAGYYAGAVVDQWPGDIAICVGITGDRPSDSLMKRLQNYAGFSYKIACS
jgi:hypothetical protein